MLVNQVGEFDTTVYVGWLVFAKLYYKLDTMHLQLLFISTGFWRRCRGWYVFNLLLFTLVFLLYLNFFFVNFVIHLIFSWVVVFRPLFSCFFYFLSKKDQKYNCGCGIYMIVWVRESKRRRLTRIEPEPEFQFEKMVGTR